MSSAPFGGILLCAPVAQAVLPQARGGIVIAPVLGPGAHTLTAVLGTELAISGGGIGVQPAGEHFADLASVVGGLEHVPGLAALEVV